MRQLAQACEEVIADLGGIGCIFSLHQIRRRAPTGNGGGRSGDRIAPDRYNVIDGIHRLAKARRERLRRTLVHRLRCPHHVASLVGIVRCGDLAAYGPERSLWAQQPFTVTAGYRKSKRARIHES